jgi:2-iminobutanoate/2-iminopropanoate deaminase
MSLEKVVTDKAPAAIGPYSQALKANGFVFVSGQIPLDPVSGQLVEGGFRAQARRALENLKQVLTASGAGLEGVVAVDVFVTDMGQFGVFNAVYEEFFSAHRPARAVVEVSGLPKGAMVEIKCVAALPSA